MFDVNQLYNFSLPMTVANTPHGNLRDMSGMDIRESTGASPTGYSGRLHTADS